MAALFHRAAIIKTVIRDAQLLFAARLYVKSSNLHHRIMAQMGNTMNIYISYSVFLRLPGKLLNIICLYSSYMLQRALVLTQPPLLPSTRCLKKQHRCCIL